MPVGAAKPYPVFPRDHPLFQFRSKRYDEDYELISDFETIGDWTLGGGESIAVDAVNFKEGSQGVKFCSIDNAVTFADRTLSPKCIGKHFSIWIYVDDVDNLETIDFYFRSVDGTWSHLLSSIIGAGHFQTGWNKKSPSRSAFSKVGSADWNDINMVRLRVKSIAGKTVNVTFDDYRMIRDRFGAKVTLRFDDGRIGGYNEARARMDKYGFRGVAAIYIDGVDAADRLTLAQFQHLEERGWDIISHSVSHENLTTLSAAEVEQELWNSQRWLIENGFYKGSRFFIPPMGAVNSAVREQIEKYYLASQWQVSSGEMERIPPVDPLNLYAANIGSEAAATVTGWIDKAIEDNSWLTLIFYDVDGAGYPAADFQTIIDYLYNNEVEVVTFSDVFDELIGSKHGVKTQLLEFGVQGEITPNATSFPCAGGGLAAQTANEIKIPISRNGFLKNLRVRQRLASGGAGLTDIYTVRVNGVDTDLTCTLDNETVGSDLVHNVHVVKGDEISTKLVSNNAGDVSADVSVSVELELLM